MKNAVFAFWTALILINCACASYQPASEGVWKLAGQCDIVQTSTSVTISNVAPEVFSHIKLKIKRCSVNVNRIEVSFESGSPKKIDIQRSIAAGESTQAFQTNTRSVIKRVDIAADMKNSNSQCREAIIELWGKNE